MQTILHSLARAFTRQKNRTRFLSLLLAMAMLPLTGLGSPTVSADVSSGAVQHGPAAEMRQVGTTTLDVVTPNVTFKQGDGEVLVAPNLNLNGPANGTLDKVTVTLDNGFVGNQDALSLPPMLILVASLGSTIIRPVFWP